jgi:hypothetical protein
MADMEKPWEEKLAEEREKTEEKERASFKGERPAEIKSIEESKSNSMV